ncbi:MAG: MFS transporter [Thermanaeromonas sp.]|uniref:MFS transporter n=1 Tax=Thermanaeromonas sp. TaxID=2003697 RepID=UPI00243A31DF|nr:MFS transporter [Thermanaeromonas sp.]MCG0277278.1 MFS transporter [Thermanaeromonas sp.]
MKRKAWAVMWAAYLGGVAVAMNQFKVPPVMGVLMKSLHVDMATAGWLMSVFSLAGVILAFPAALLLARLGPKVSGLIGLGCCIFGSIMGALAQGPEVMLVGRTIEGIGLALIAVVAPAVISMWFEPQERGLPMGIWSTWVPVGTFLMYNLANPMEKLWGWASIWWFGAAFALVAFIVYSAIVTVPDRVESAGEVQDSAKPSLGLGLRSTNSWLLALSFAGFNFSFIGYSTWAPLFLNQVHKIDPTAASFYVSLTTLVCIPGGIIAGWALDRTRNRKGVLITAFVIAVILLVWAFKLGESVSTIVAYFVVLGVVVSFVPTTTFTLAPETAPDPRLAGVALATVIFGQNAGMLLGPPIIGRTVAGGGWIGGTYPLLIGTIISLTATLLIRSRAK